MTVTEVTSSTWDETVMKAAEPVFVDFWAEWCGPCKIVSPLVEELSEKFSGMKFTKLDVDQNPEIADRYGIRGIPTLMIFKGGQIANQTVGAAPKDALVQQIESVLQGK
ncbi:MAG: thioredoxin [Nitrososphaerales archaeon]